MINMNLSSQESGCDAGYRGVLRCQQCYGKRLMQIYSSQHQEHTSLSHPKGHSGFVPGYCYLASRLLHPLLAGPPACAILPLQLNQNAVERMFFTINQNSPTLTRLLCTLHWLLVAAPIQLSTAACLLC